MTTKLVGSEKQISFAQTILSTLTEVTAKIIAAPYPENGSPAAMKLHPQKQNALTVQRTVKIVAAILAGDTDGAEALYGEGDVMASLPNWLTDDGEVKAAALIDGLKEPFSRLQKVAAEL